MLNVDSEPVPPKSPIKSSKASHLPPAQIEGTAQTPGEVRLAGRGITPSPRTVELRGWTCSVLRTFSRGGPSRRIRSWGACLRFGQSVSATRSIRRHLIQPNPPRADHVVRVSGNCFPWCIGTGYYETGQYAVLPAGAGGSSFRFGFLFVRASPLENSQLARRTCLYIASDPTEIGRQKEPRIVTRRMAIA